MAEGRSATLLFQLQKRGFNVTGSQPDSEDSGFVTLRLHIPVPWMMAKKMRELVSATLALLSSRLFPASITTFLTVQTFVVLVTVFAESDSWLRSGWVAELLWTLDSALNPLQHLLSIRTRVAYLSAAAALWGFLLIVATERFLLRILLSFGPHFLFVLKHTAQQQHQSVFSTYIISLWKYFVHKLNATSSTQLCLPAQPVPRISHTIKSFLTSIEPVLSREEFDKVSILAKDFQRKEAGKLNMYLHLRTFLCNNYITPWFERYVYLSSRQSLAGHTNYYMMDCEVTRPVKDQVFRAANLCHHICQFSVLIPTLQTPLIHRGTIPLCMKQYSRLFGTCRIPGRESDVLKHNPLSDYIAVLRCGKFYKLDVKIRDRFLNPAEFAHQLRLICEHASLDRANASYDMASLTSLPRTRWAEIRDAYFGEGRNRKNLLLIENSLFFLHLVHDPAPATLKKRAKFLFHGLNGADIWFDKSFSLLVFEHGEAGLNCENSFGDAPVVAHMWEYALLRELVDFENSCDASALAGESLIGTPLFLPHQIEFAVPHSLDLEIKAAKRLVISRANEIQLQILHFTLFGRERLIHELKLSPDAFIQVCLLWTTFVELNGELSLAYESCHTRMFREGRTETIRSCTKQAMAFVRCMTTKDGKSSRKEKQQLFAEACRVHSELSLECSVGRGVDRHLFALNVAARGLEVTSKFLDYVHTHLKWSISSSQHPQVQTKIRQELPKEISDMFASSGGGYAPISSKGYGVAYTFTAREIFFHITCEKSSQQTNAKRFKATLRRCLEEAFELMSSPPDTVS